MRNKLGGILPALITPLTPEQRLHTAALEQLLERVYNAGVDGVYVCGSTGEGLALPADVRRRIVETAVGHSPRGKQVIVHVGAGSLAEAQNLARHAAETGAAAISSLPPSGASFPTIVEYYRALAATTDLPFLGYYFPAAGTGTFSQSQLAEICAIPGIAGLKFTDYDLFTLSVLVREGNVVFNGRDEVLCAGLLMGAHGGIGSVYNLVPEWFVELYGHARGGRWREARELQDRINDLLRVILGFPFLPALKWAITLQGIAGGEALASSGTLTPDQGERLRAALGPVLLERTAV